MCKRKRGTKIQHGRQEEWKKRLQHMIGQKTTGHTEMHRDRAKSYGTHRTIAHNKAKGHGTHRNTAFSAGGIPKEAHSSLR
eukprot:scaffold295517_cov18-Tisochrysis_lutea.AAC.1